MEKQSKPFQCKQCPQAFSSATIMRIHEGKHNQSKISEDKQNGDVESFFNSSIFEKENDIEEVGTIKLTYSQLAKKINSTTDVNGETLYNCAECDYISTISYDAIQHLKSNHGYGLKTDTEPRKTYSQGMESQLAKKFSITVEENGGKNYNCNECYFVTELSSNAFKHLIDHHGDDVKTYSCDDCSYTSTYASNLRHHRRSHSDKRPYPCDECPKAFKTNAKLKIHKHTHTGLKLHKCDVCHKSYSTSTTLNTHKMIHTGEILIQKLKFPCDQCPKSFSAPSALNTHKKSHSEEKPIACEQCSKRFKTISAAQVHMKKHIEGTMRKYTNGSLSECPECLKTFAQPGLLKRHMVVHTGEKPFSCDICNESFSQNSGLLRHKRGHTGEKPRKRAKNDSGEKLYGSIVQCSECSKTFTQQAHLKRHMVVHTGEKPFSCDICNESFSQSSGLIRHARTHTGEKPFPCPHPGCSMSFAQSSTQKRHTDTHLKIKPFACPHPGCPRSFTQSNTQKRHTETHNRFKPIACPHPECSRSFAKLPTMKRHAKDAHGIKLKKKYTYKNKVKQEIKEEEYDYNIKVEQEDYDSDENNMDEDEDDENLEFFTCDGCKENFDNITFETHIEKCEELAILMDSSVGTADVSKEITQCKSDTTDTEEKDSYVKCDGCLLTFDKKTFEKLHLATCSKFVNVDVKKEVDINQHCE